MCKSDIPIIVRKRRLFRLLNPHRTNGQPILGCNCSDILVREVVANYIFFSSYVLIDILKRPTIILYVPNMINFLNRYQYMPVNLKEQTRYNHKYISVKQTCQHP